MLKFTRRQVLKASAAAAAMAAVGGCASKSTQQAPTQAGIEVEEWFKSVCRYCGTGCGVLIGTKAGKVVSVKGDPDNSVNKGTLCVKGFFLPSIHYAENRLKKPLIKENGKFREATWDEALGLMAAKFKEAIEQYGPNSVAYYGSGQSTVEEGYVVNKLFKGCIGTNNVEGNPRTCMASAVAGYLTTFGKDEPMGIYEDIEAADVFFIIGSNTAEAHPILYARVAERKKSGKDVKVIVADPRITRTFDIADYKVNFTPGSDLALMNAMAHVIIKEGLHDPEFMANHVMFKQTVDGNHEDRTWDDYVSFLENYSPEKVAPICGIPAEDIIEIARVFAAKGKNTMSMWCMGINQRIRGVWANNLIHNLHLITGKICKPGSTPFSLTGQPSACGTVREVGVLSHLLPGHRFIVNEKHREEVAKVWGVDPAKIQPQPGMHMMKMFEGTYTGEIKCMWVVCTNPGHTLPNVNRYREGMEKTFLVVSEAYHPTRTSELADIVLPSAIWCEKEGVYGNAERRTQHMAKAIEPPGEAKSDLWAMLEFAKRMGYGELFAHYKTNEDIWAEWRTLTIGTGMDLAEYKAYKEARGLLWPVVNGQETKRRFVYPDDPYVKPEEKIKFYGKPNGKAWVFLRPMAPAAEQPDAEYPYWFTTGRILEHWHTSTMTATAPQLAKIPGDYYVEIHATDAAREGIKDGDLVKISSKRGSITVKAKIGGRGVPQPGMLFCPMHDMDRNRLVNIVVSDAVDGVSFQPEYKISAVKIEKV